MEDFMQIQFSLSMDHLEGMYGTIINQCHEIFMYSAYEEKNIGF
jgi:hypothetical protein